MNTKNELSCKIDQENIKRLKPILSTVAGILLLQIIVYMLGDNMDFKELVIIKMIIVASIGMILLLFKRIKVETVFFKQQSQKIIQVITLWLIILAVFSSFYAQEISSDITIYIMVLFVITAGVRMRPLLTGINIVVSYVIFVIGMPLYQSNAEYLTSHIINGFIINILTLMISYMFYKYSVNEYNDKMEIENTNILLKKLSERDSLTDLYNARTINAMLDSYLQTQANDLDHLHLGMLDLDDFKEVNDKYGHAYGDVVLKIVASKILKNIRFNDIAGRYGGDEFMIIFKDKNRQQIEKIMYQLSKEIYDEDFRDITLTFSCGIVAWNGETRDVLFEKADTYMYDAKHSGKNQIKLQKA